MTKFEKSHFAQFRCGILPLRVETGRYSGLSVHERTCNICNSNENEDDIYFLFKCSCYHDLRQSLINKATETKANFLLINDVEKLRYVVENHFIYIAKLLLMLCNEESLYSIIKNIHLLPVLYILADFNYATLTFPYIFQKTVEC